MTLLIIYSAKKFCTDGFSGKSRLVMNSCIQCYIIVQGFATPRKRNFVYSPWKHSYYDQYRLCRVLLVFLPHSVQSTYLCPIQALTVIWHDLHGSLHLPFTLYTDKLYTFLGDIISCFCMTYNIFFIYYVFQMSDAGVMMFPLNHR